MDSSHTPFGEDDTKSESGGERSHERTLLLFRPFSGWLDNPLWETLSNRSNLHLLLYPGTKKKKISEMDARPIVESGSDADESYSQAPTGVFTSIYAIHPHTELSVPTDRDREPSNLDNLG